MYADLLKDNNTNITQQLEKDESSEVQDVGFTSDSKILTWLGDDHNYEDYSGVSVIQSILDVNGWFLFQAHTPDEFVFALHN